MVASKAKSANRKISVKAKKAQRSHVYGTGADTSQKRLGNQKAAAKGRFKKIRELGACLLEGISARLLKASEKLDLLAKKTR